MRLLVISSAYSGCSVAYVRDGDVLAQEDVADQIGLAAALPVAVETVLARAGRGLDAIGVVVGPGSFTGLRAGISVAVGVGLALGVPVVGVSVAEALAAALPVFDGRRLWVATEARRGRVFIDADGRARGHATDMLPTPDGPVAIAGNAAIFVAGALAAKGFDVMLTGARVPGAAAIAEVGAQRLAGALPPLAALPLYVDAPEAKLPAGGLRGAPV